MIRPQLDIWKKVPVNDVGQQVIVLEPVVHIHLIVVDSQGAIQYASLL